MSQTMCHAIMIGRISKDPEIYQRDGRNGVFKVSRFPIAVDEPYNGMKNDQGGPATSFFNCELMGAPVDFVEKYVHQGDLVSVTGRFRQEKYTKDGTINYIIKFIVKDISVIMNAGAGNTQNTARGRQNQNADGQGYNSGQNSGRQQNTGGRGYNSGQNSGRQQNTGGQGYNSGQDTGGRGYNSGQDTGGQGYNSGQDTGGQGYNNYNDYGQNTGSGQDYGYQGYEEPYSTPDEESPFGSIFS